MRESIVADAVVTREQIPVRTLMPAIAVMVFLAMVAIGERQVRSSLKWPPPARHEVGAWEIGNPAVLDWAAGLNLPASVPILALWLNTYAFEYALDDHELWAYVPWSIFVWCLWYFIACHVDHFINGRAWSSSRHRNLVLCGQILLTVEMVFVVSTIRPTFQSTQERAAIACISLWLLLTFFGWVNLIVKR
jgi:hypothetical protein